MNTNRERLSSAKKSQLSHHRPQQSHQDIDAILAVVEAGQHRPGPEWARRTEALSLGKPYVPAGMSEAEARRFIAAQRLKPETGKGCS